MVSVICGSVVLDGCLTLYKYVEDAITAEELWMDYFDLETKLQSTFCEAVEGYEEEICNITEALMRSFEK